MLNLQEVQVFVAMQEGRAFVVIEEEGVGGGYGLWECVDMEGWVWVWEGFQEEVKLGTVEVLV